MKELFHNLSPEGWYWSNKFSHWQKKNHRVYCYVTPILFGVQTNLYISGTAATCELEVRTEDTSMNGIQKMFSVAEVWLSLYADGDLEKIHSDKFSILNPEGVWRKNPEKKEWWI